MKHAVSISTEQLDKATSRDIEKIKLICDALAFDASVSQELSVINELCESQQQDESDKRMDAFSVRLEFQGRSLDIGLSSMNVYDSFCRLLDTYVSELDM